MESNDLKALSELYLKTVYEQKAESPEEEEEKDKQDDDLAGSPNKNGKKNGKKKAKRWWDDDGDGKGYEKGEVDGKFKKEEYEVTAADKKGNTPAWQGYKAGKKNVKTGKPLYKAAAHLKKEEVELESEIDEGLLVKAAQGVEKVGGAINKADKALGKAAMNRVVKPVARAAGKGVKKVAAATARGAVGAVSGAVKGAAKGIKKGLSEEQPSNKGALNRQEIDSIMGMIYEKEVEFTEEKKSKKKGHNCASKVKHEEYGMGDCIKEMHTLDEDGNVTHYDVMFESKIVKNIPVSDLVVIEGMYHEHVVNDEKNQEVLSEKEVNVKDTKKVVDAIRAYDKSKDASRDATADSDEGDKEKAAIEKKYAAKERGEIDKDDPNWKKRKYHTGMHGEEVESLVASGKFSNEELMSIANLQEADIADILARLEKKRISKGGDPEESPLPAMRKYHADKKKKKVKEDYWMEFEEGYQRNPEKGEEEERKEAKKGEAIRGQARRRMPPRGNKDREEFERWYAANVR
tara:strand:+ start:437 stop:1990 length:1554 start_codon:yes stop_codon:yes gene_type:complete